MLVDATDRWDVPLMISRGYSSLSFLHSAAEHIAASGKHGIILHFGDYDPSGVDIGDSIRDGIAEHIGADAFDFERVAVNPDQIAEMNLPTRPTKKSDSRAAGFAGDSVELDAIEPDVLRQMVNDSIERYVDHRQLAVIREAETSERELFKRLAGCDPDELDDLLSDDFDDFDD